MSAPIRIERWACKASGDPYLPPEVGGIRIRGDVFGHYDKRFKDGDRVTTGVIVEVNGRTVKTVRGSVYELGDPDPRYIDWLREKGIQFDPEHPIQTKRHAS